MERIKIHKKVGDVSRFYTCRTKTEENLGFFFAIDLYVASTVVHARPKYGGNG